MALRRQDFTTSSFNYYISLSIILKTKRQRHSLIYSKKIVISNYRLLQRFLTKNLICRCRIVASFYLLYFFNSIFTYLDASGIFVFWKFLVSFAITIALSKFKNMCLTCKPANLIAFAKYHLFFVDFISILIFVFVDFSCIKNLLFI